jgi:Uma2 family endonuclease
MNDMSAVLQLPYRMTTAEFLAWHPGDGQVWQLVDGEPEAMAPASETHGRIQSEIARLLANHLADHGSPCAVVTAPGIQPYVRASSNVRIPDLAITCAPPVADAGLTQAPVLAVEIISPSNERETWRNVWTYTTIPALQEILCVRAAYIGVELLRRRPDGSWPEEPEKILTGPLHLASVGFTCDVAALYRTTHLAMVRPG